MSFADLPNDLLLHIFALCDGLDLIELVCCCRRFYDFIKSNRSSFRRIDFEGAITVEYGHDHYIFLAPSLHQASDFDKKVTFCFRSLDCHCRPPQGGYPEVRAPLLRPALLTQTPFELWATKLERTTYTLYSDTVYRGYTSDTQREEQVFHVDCPEDQTKFSGVCALLDHISTWITTRNCEVKVASLRQLETVLYSLEEIEALKLQDIWPTDELLRVLNRYDVKELSFTPDVTPTKRLFASSVVQPLRRLDIEGSFLIFEEGFALGKACVELHMENCILQRESVRKLLQEWASSQRRITLFSFRIHRHEGRFEFALLDLTNDPGSISVARQTATLGNPTAMRTLEISPGPFHGIDDWSIDIREVDY